MLEAAEAAGVAIPSLCRAGVCGTCRTRVSDGEVDVRVHGASAPAIGPRATCSRAWPGRGRRCVVEA